jgi:hypothetical protein
MPNVFNEDNEAGVRSLETIAATEAGRPRGRSREARHGCARAAVAQASGPAGRTHAAA